MVVLGVEMVYVFIRFHLLNSSRFGLLGNMGGGGGGGGGKLGHN